MADAYDLVARGKLKLKSDSNSSKKKKNKDKKKERERMGRGVRQEQETYAEDERIANSTAPKMTKAEQSFKKMQEKMVSLLLVICFSGSKVKNLYLHFSLQQEKRIMEKAATTHKQRVEKFNEHLDSLTEHFDIPKVSWTK